MRPGQWKGTAVKSTRASSSSLRTSSVLGFILPLILGALAGATVLYIRPMAGYATNGKKSSGAAQTHSTGATSNLRHANAPSQPPQSSQQAGKTSPANGLASEVSSPNTASGIKQGVKQEADKVQSGVYSGTWQNSKGRDSSFSLYLMKSEGAMFSAIGTVEGWTCVELYKGTAQGNTLTLTGQDVLFAQRPREAYALDVLELEIVEEGQKLHGDWQDTRSNSGRVRLRFANPLDSGHRYVQYLKTLSQGAPKENAGPATTTAQNAPAPDYKIAINGIGPIRLGMSAAEVERGWGEPLRGDRNRYGDTSCYRAAPAGFESGLIFWIVGDKLSHIVVSTPAFATKSGAKIGDSAGSLKKLYPGRLTIRQNPDHDGTDYLFVPKDAEDSQYRLCFIVRNDYIREIQIGTVESMSMKEFCL